MTAASAIRSARLRAGMTQSQLAARMGTTQTAIARLEAPQSNPRWTTLARALEAAGERLVISTEPAPVPDLDLAQLRVHCRMSPAERAHAHDVAYDETRELVLAAASGQRR